MFVRSRAGIWRRAVVGHPIKRSGARDAPQKPIAPRRIVAICCRPTNIFAGGTYHLIALFPLYIMWEIRSAFDLFVGAIQAFIFGAADNFVISAKRSSKRNTTGCW